MSQSLTAVESVEVRGGRSVAPAPPCCESSGCRKRGGGGYHQDGVAAAGRVITVHTAGAHCLTAAAATAMPACGAGSGSDGARTALLTGCSALVFVALLSLNRANPIWCAGQWGFYGMDCDQLAQSRHGGGPTQGCIAAVI